MSEPHIVVVGLGPAGPEFLSDATRAALSGAARAFLRTSVHPAAAGLAVPSFDRLYEEAASFEEVYAGIVAELAEAASEVAPQGGTVVYGVPGSPLVAERTVELLRQLDGVRLTIEPSLSFLDLAWLRLGIDPVATGVRLLEASDLKGRLGAPTLVVQCWSKEHLSALKLSAEDTSEEPPPVTILHHLGLTDERVETVPWWDLDRTLEPDHLTSVFVPAPVDTLAGAMLNLEELVRTLRERCPWDREQTHASLGRHLLEESYEVLDAIDTLSDATVLEDADLLEGAMEHLCEELGDLLFQVCFHAGLANEEGAFNLADVARNIHDKLVARHPHVFADFVADTPDAVAANWEVIKKAEKGRASVTDGIPTALPALALATKLLRKGDAVGLAGEDQSTRRQQLRDLVDSLPGASDGPIATAMASGTDLEEQVGITLLALANLSQQLGVEPESALRRAALVLRDRIVEAERT